MKYATWSNSPAGAKTNNLSVRLAIRASTFAAVGGQPNFSSVSRNVLRFRPFQSRFKNSGVLPHFVACATFPYSSLTVYSHLQMQALPHSTDRFYSLRATTSALRPFYIRLRSDTHVDVLVDWTAFTGVLPDARIDGLTSPPSASVARGFLGARGASAALDDGVLTLSLISGDFALALVVPVEAVASAGVIDDAFQQLVAGNVMWRAAAVGQAIDGAFWGEEANDRGGEEEEGGIEEGEVEKDGELGGMARARYTELLKSSLEDVREVLSGDVAVVAGDAFMYAELPFGFREKCVAARIKRMADEVARKEKNERQRKRRATPEGRVTKRKRVQLGFDDADDSDGGKESGEEGEPASRKSRDKVPSPFRDARKMAEKSGIPAPSAACPKAGESNLNAKESAGTAEVASRYAAASTEIDSVARGGEGNGNKTRRGGGGNQSLSFQDDDDDKAEVQTVSAVPEKVPLERASVTSEPKAANKKKTPKKVKKKKKGLV